MIGVILAAGMAKRLRPLTNERPKCLLEISGKSFLARSIDSLVQSGIKEFVIITGYLGEMIRHFITANYPEYTFHFKDNVDYATTNNIYSLWLTREFVDGKDFLLLDSDIIYDPQLVKTMASQPQPALAVNRHELGEEEMKVVVNDRQEIIEINKTCDPQRALGESVGVERVTPAYSKALFEELEVMIEKEKLVDIFYEKAFERLIPLGQTFTVVDTTELFSIEVDTPEDYEQLKNSFNG